MPTLRTPSVDLDALIKEEEEEEEEGIGSRAVHKEPPRLGTSGPPSETPGVGFPNVKHGEHKKVNGVTSGYMRAVSTWIIDISDACSHH
ncbi:hypothetical protein B296_00019170 [Ensete ventricosum]|uniref:Uncharacterized protein n=1 Tax=Ensete ventricosum TaxID=4639 RepID=A0A427AKI6_ENSVE|nr:hypothetical protein B296_00019170 [Ensete ventricosum]